MSSILTHPEDVRTVFNDSNKHTKAVNNNAGWLMGEILGKCVGLISGTDWQTLRMVTQGPFLHNNSAAYIPFIERWTRDHFESLRVHGRLSQGLINPVEDLKMLPFRIVGEIIYGELSPDMETELMTLIPIRESLFRQMIVGRVSRFQISRYLPIKANRMLSEFKKRWTTFNERVYEESSEKAGDTPFLQMYKEVQNGTISYEQLLQTLDEVLFANLDVTIGGISWNLLFLGGVQDAQSDLRTEIMTHKRDAHGAQKQWERYLQSSSTLLAASILESARLRPLAGFSIPQAAPTDRTVGGYVVPAGTNFVIDAYALNVRNSYWGDDRTQYRPTRFLERNAAEIRYHYWRFGFGPRTCMGRYVVDLILRVILAHLVENYTLSLLGNAGDWDRNAETWITHPTSDVRCEKLTNMPED